MATITKELSELVKEEMEKMERLILSKECDTFLKNLNEKTIFKKEDEWYSTNSLTNIIITLSNMCKKDQFIENYLLLNEYNITKDLTYLWSFEFFELMNKLETYYMSEIYSILKEG